MTLTRELPKRRGDYYTEVETEVLALNDSQKGILDTTLYMISIDAELDKTVLLNFTSKLVRAYLTGEKDYYYRAMQSNVYYSGSYVPFSLFFLELLNEIEENAATDEESILIEKFRIARTENGFTEILEERFPSLENFRRPTLSEQTQVEEEIVPANSPSVNILCQEILNFALFNSQYSPSEFEEFYLAAVNFAVVENNQQALCLIRSIKQLARIEQVLQREYRKKKLIGNYQPLHRLDLARKIAVPPYLLNNEYQDIPRISTNDLYTLREIKRLVELGFASIDDKIYALGISSQLSALGVSSQFADFFGVADIGNWISEHDEVKTISAQVRTQAQDRILNLSISVKNQGQICIVNSKKLLKEYYIEVNVKAFCRQKQRSEEEIAEFERILRIKFHGSLGFFDIIERRCFALSKNAFKNQYNNYSQRLISLLQQVTIKHETFHQMNRSNNPTIDLLSDEISTWNYTVREFAKLGIRVRFIGKIVCFEEANTSRPLTLFRTLAQQVLKGRVIKPEYLQQLRQRYPRAEKAITILATGNHHQLNKLANNITIKTARRNEVSVWVNKVYGKHDLIADDVIPLMLGELTAKE